MLHDLSIRNILYIDRLDLTFGPGLNVLTGETGAGKSILLDALGFVTGVRAGRDLLRSRASSGDVSAGFVIESDHPVQDWLRNQQIACHGDLLLRRTITGSGRTVSFANGSRITAGQLTEIGTQLVDIHGSRKEMGLLNPSEHCRFLDFFAGSTRDARTVHDRWTAVRDLRRRQDDLEAELAEMEKEADYNAHVVAELENLGLEDGEVEVLEQARVRLKAAMKIRTRVEEVRLMSGMEGALGTLIDAIRSLERIDDACGPEIKTAMQALTVATHEIEEAQVQLDRFLGTLDVASDTIEDTEDRLYLIRQLARKHRVQPEELRSVLARLAGQEDRREHLAQECDRIVAAIRAARESYLSDARKLSRLRHAAGDRLDRAVDGELAALRLNVCQESDSLQ
ncbi:MAG: AAA family ATPase, partial [Rhodobacteraceae bacterium]|nr:AAA family ATPase [Paracoccaceae bacterium]